ncbi:unnamed protein product [Enterobius vermicularis]|uniref:FERM central domain-containing protein n=1 Tax=Enterobius vermicularis TaxID=51028 RepID=A0A158Q9V0_ENTVE|nr:unnamed protein product [Enterobius vermicularis]
MTVQTEPELEAALVADERVKEEYKELKERILTGNLPCPKDQAAFLASIQLSVERELMAPVRKTQELHQQLAKGQFERMREMAQKMMITPWEMEQKVAASSNLAKELALKRRSVISPEIRPRRTNILSCVSDPEPMLPMEIQKKILPLSFVNDRKTNRLIQERKRKLFHSRIYENEISLKKLYIEIIEFSVSL